MASAMEVNPGLVSSPIALPAITPSPPAATPQVANCTPTPARAALSVVARSQFTDSLTAEINRQIESKCFPAAIASGLFMLVVVARYSITVFGTRTGLVIALAIAFVVAGIVFKVVRGLQEDKYLRPIPDLSDEMLVNRYNEAKSDRTAARARSAIGWVVTAVIVVVLIIVWTTEQRH